MRFRDSVNLEGPYLVDNKELKKAEKEGNRVWIKEQAEVGLCLSWTKTPNNRSLPTNSKEWRSLRKKVMENYNFTCRFCGLKSKKWMYCDHIDGDATNNSMENLGVNCMLCDRIRHSGRARIMSEISIWESNIDQVEIVKMTQEYWKKNGSLPLPNEIDPDAIPMNQIQDWSDNTKKGLQDENHKMLKEFQLRCRGFFSEDSQELFSKILPLKN